MGDFIMYEKYLEQLEEAGKIRNLKERSINCYCNIILFFTDCIAFCSGENIVNNIFT